MEKKFLKIKLSEDELKELLLQRREEGRTLQEVGDELGVTREMVRQHYRRMFRRGWTRRKLDYEKRALKVEVARLRAKLMHLTQKYIKATFPFRRCSDCKEMKLKSCFILRKGKVNKDGKFHLYYSSICRECLAIRTERWRKANRERFLAYQREYQRRKREHAGR